MTCVFVQIRDRSAERTRSEPCGVVVDWVGKRLYWSDSSRLTIESSQLNGSQPRTVIYENAGEPRALAINPVSG